MFPCTLLHGYVCIFVCIKCKFDLCPRRLKLNLHFEIPSFRYFYEYNIMTQTEFKKNRNFQIRIFQHLLNTTINYFDHYYCHVFNPLYKSLFVMSYKSPNNTNKCYLYFQPYLLAYNQNIFKKSSLQQTPGMFLWETLWII